MSALKINIYTSLCIIYHIPMGTVKSWDENLRPVQPLPGISGIRYRHLSAISGIRSRHLSAISGIRFHVPAFFSVSVP